MLSIIPDTSSILDQMRLAALNLVVICAAWLAVATVPLVVWLIVRWVKRRLEPPFDFETWAYYARNPLDNPPDKPGE